MSVTKPINFASDNAAPVCPEVMTAIMAANDGPALGYGNDQLTRDVENRLKDIFERDLKAYPVATGTAANVLGLSVMTPPWGTVYCHELAHIEQDECGAPEFYTGGAKLSLMQGENGKIDPADLEKRLSVSGQGVVHHSQPAALSLTQSTECGTVYSPTEIAALSDVARSHGLGVHMDGARFANALVSLNCSAADITWKSGVDILSFGGTKNGAMAVEAVIIFDPEKAQEFEFRRKRGAHLFSKLRYLSAQLDGYLSNDVWLKNARHANDMVRILSEKLAPLDHVTQLYPAQANELFLQLPEEKIQALEAENFLFYVMDDTGNRQARFVTSWNSSEAEIDALVDCLS